MSRLSSILMNNLLTTGIENVHQRGERFDTINVEDLVSVAACAQQIIDAAVDVRALATVEAQVLNADRPNLTKLAAVQGVAPSGLRRRYSENLASILKNAAGGEQLDERALLAELKSFDADTSLQLTDVKTSHSTGSSPTQRTLETPSLRTVLSDPLVKISTRIDENERRRITNAYALLGRIHETLRGSLTDAVDFDSWVAAGGSGIGMQWSHSLRIDQVLPLLLPLERDGVQISGIGELALKNAQSNEATLIWSRGPRKLSVRLIRSA